MLRNKHRLKKVRICFIVMLVYFGFLGYSQPVSADVQDVFDTKETQDVFLYRGDLVAVKVYSLTRLAVSTPGIIEIANADVDELLLIGQSTGQTALFIWDEFGKRKIMVRVLEEDLDLVVSRMQRLLTAAGIDGVIMEKNILERKVIIRGEVARHHKEQMGKIITEFKSYIIDMLVYEGDLIQIDIQVSELTTTLQKALGIDWNTGASGSMILQYEEAIPAFDGSIGDLFKIGDFSRTTQILAIVNALIQEGQARVLSKPTIVVTAGDEATFLVGGEIPVRTTTSSSGGTTVQENVTYSSYGVTVTVMPKIQHGKIDTTLNVTIRDIDASNAVGENVAFVTRTATTKLFLNNGQTIVLAGLIKQNKAETMTGVPFLRRIPIVGMLFRNRSWPANSETEVVISITPRIISQKDMAKASQNLKEKYKISKEEEAAISETSAKESKNISNQSENLIPSVKSEDKSVAPTAETTPAAINVSQEQKENAQPTPESKIIEAEVAPTPEKERAPVSEGETISPAPEGNVKKIPEGESSQVPEDIKKEQVIIKPSDQETGNKGNLMVASATAQGDAAIQEAQKVASAEKETIKNEVKETTVAKEQVLQQVVKAETGIPTSAVVASKEPKTVQDEKTTQAISNYVKAVQMRISQAVSFPLQAKEKGWQGTVTLSLDLLSDGSLNDVKVKNSSGHDIFDKDAVNTTKILAPFDPFPPDIQLEQLTVNIPIVYSQEAVLEGSEQK